MNKIYFYFLFALLVMINELELEKSVVPAEAEENEDEKIAQFVVLRAYQSEEGNPKGISSVKDENVISSGNTANVVNGTNESEFVKELRAKIAKFEQQQLTPKELEMANEISEIKTRLNKLEKDLKEHQQKQLNDILKMLAVNYYKPTLDFAKGIRIEATVSDKGTFRTFAMVPREQEQNEEKKEEKKEKKEEENKEKEEQSKEKKEEKKEKKEEENKEKNEEKEEQNQEKEEEDKKKKKEEEQNGE